MTSYQPVHESREFETFDELYEISEAEGLDVKTLTPRQLALASVPASQGGHGLARSSSASSWSWSFFAPVFARYGVNEPVFPISEGPNQFLEPQSIAWFGTDDIGRDIYSRLLYGIRTSIFIGVATGIIATVIGTAVGADRRAARREARRRPDAGHRRVPRVPVPRRRHRGARVHGRADVPRAGRRRQDVDPVHHLPARDLRLDGRGPTRARAGAVAEGA